MAVRAAERLREAGVRPGQLVGPRFAEDGGRYWLRTGRASHYTSAAIEQLRDAYDDAIRYQDAEVGALIDGLSGRGQLEQTILMVFGDHGEEFAEHGMMGHDNNLYLPSLRVPLLIRYSARVSKGARVKPRSHDHTVDPEEQSNLVTADRRSRPRLDRGSAAGWPAASTGRVAVRRTASTVAKTQRTVALTQHAATAGQSPCRSKGKIRLSQGSSGARLAGPGRDVSQPRSPW